MTSSVSLQASDGGDEVVRSPLSQAPAPVDAPEGASKLPLMGVKKETQAVLTYIKQVSFCFIFVIGILWSGRTIFFANMLLSSLLTWFRKF
jgi:hypothetical protein